jgi:adenylate cyclase
MTVADTKSNKDTSRPASAWTRDARLVSGCILMVFAVSHFINHALGIFGVATMETVQNWRYLVWHSWVGTAALYGSFLIHPFLGLLRVAQKRTFRMPLREMVQIGLGICIPFFLVDHIVGTRGMGTFFVFDESYTAVLRRLWPGLALSQSILLLIVWIHGSIGLHYTLSTRTWYARWRDVMLVTAVLVPVLALIGFAIGGREALLMNLPGETYSDAQINMFNRDVTVGKTAFISLIGGFVAFILWREIRLRTAKQITIRFVGHGVRKIRPGPTLLEISRRFQIPHAALCGGRARCATCRVLVLDGEDTLPSPHGNEEKLLRRISAPPHVRLACQLRPKHDIQVKVLLGTETVASAGSHKFDHGKTGGAIKVSVLIADLRAFYELSQRQLPHELMVLLNRFYDEMNHAITAHNGRIEAFYGDGLMAIFGPERNERIASRGAIDAAINMLRAVDALNREFASAAPLPLRIGIGIETGEAIVGTVESESAPARAVTVGETVMVAGQIEASTRRFLADLIISDATLVASGRSYPEAAKHTLAIKGRQKSVIVHALHGAEQMSEAELEPEKA